MKPTTFSNFIAESTSNDVVKNMEAMIKALNKAEDNEAEARAKKWADTGRFELGVAKAQAQAMKSQYSVVKGSKYYKIVKQVPNDPHSRSAFGFVDATTGDIYKAASWSAPAKHARGNVADWEKSMTKAAGMYFISYLR